MSDQSEERTGRDAGAGAPAGGGADGEGRREGGNCGAANDAGARRLPNFAPTIGVGVPRGAPEAVPRLPAAAAGRGERPAREAGPPRVIEGDVTQRASQPTGVDADVGGADGVERLVRRDPAVRRSLLAHLRAIRDGQTPFGPLQLPPRAPGAEAGSRKARKGGADAAPAATAAQAQDDGRWPSGPLIKRELFSRIEVETLVEAILTDVEVMEHPSHPGLSRDRLRVLAKQAGFEPARFGRFAAYLIIWFARAGVTVKASDTWRGEWDGPRPLSTEEKEEIRLMLVRVPPPTRREVDVIRAQGFDDSAL